MGQVQGRLSPRGAAGGNGCRPFTGRKAAVRQPQSGEPQTRTQAVRTTPLSGMRRSGTRTTLLRHAAARHRAGTQISRRLAVAGSLLTAAVLAGAVLLGLPGAAQESGQAAQEAGPAAREAASRRAAPVPRKVPASRVMSGGGSRQRIRRRRSSDWRSFVRWRCGRAGCTCSMRSTPRTPRPMPQTDGSAPGWRNPGQCWPGSPRACPVRAACPKARLRGQWWR
jgi:hypothetical protein